MDRTTFNQSGSTVCAGQVSSSGGQSSYDSFCYATAVANITDGYMFTEDICRDNAHPNGTQLTFDTALEVDFRVIDGGGAETWRWSSTQSFGAQPHTLPLATGQCYRWETTWRGNTDNGRRASAGTYQLEMTPGAHETLRRQQKAFTFGG
ncbi:MAG: BsuPI-related putative proteinase inhibitor [Candidatus Dormibacteria bacterium]